MTPLQDAIIDWIQREYPHKIHIRDYNVFLEAVKFMRETYGKNAEWYFNRDAKASLYVNPGAKWERRHTYIFVKDELLAVEVKMRFG